MDPKQAGTASPQSHVDTWDSCTTLADGIYTIPVLTVANWLPWDVPQDAHVAGSGAHSLDKGGTEFRKIGHTRSHLP